MSSFMYLPHADRIQDLEQLAPDLGWYQLSPQVARFPSTRFMGSKEQLLLPLWRAIGQFAPRRVLDLCSGSGVVSYMFKAQGCEVISNDQMAMATTIAGAVVSNSTVRLANSDIDHIANGALPEGKIWNLYGDLYYDRADIEFLDHARVAVKELPKAKRAIATAALIRACIKRRPRGIFTYTGRRYDDGRKDLKLTLSEHFEAAAAQLNAAVFCNGRNSKVTQVDLSSGFPAADVDIVYLDPPYYSPLSDNHYVRRYHFTEALAKDWRGVRIQEKTKTKKIENYANPFSSELSCAQVIERMLARYESAPVVLSYSSNSLPSASAIRSVIERHGRKCELIEVDHRYSFANQATAKRPVRNKVKELIFVAHPA
jgi:DNA adenine methylase